MKTKQMMAGMSVDHFGARHSGLRRCPGRRSRRCPGRLVRGRLERLWQRRWVWRTKRHQRFAQIDGHPVRNQGHKKHGQESRRRSQIGNPADGEHERRLECDSRQRRSKCGFSARGASDDADRGACEARARGPNASWRYDAGSGKECAGHGVGTNGAGTESFGAGGRSVAGSETGSIAAQHSPGSASASTLQSASLN